MTLNELRREKRGLLNFYSVTWKFNEASEQTTHDVRGEFPAPTIAPLALKRLPSDCLQNMLAVLGHNLVQILTAKRNKNRLGLRNKERKRLHRYLSEI